ncbi:MAG: MFS transporter [Burkholderiaceae bacterium]
MTQQYTAQQPLPKVLWALLFGNFVIGTGVMIVPGTLSVISQSMDVSVAVAGQLISAGALLMCIGAPLLASVVAGWDRRHLLALSMLWYALFHALCAVMPDFASLLIVRVITMISPAIFTPQAAACISLLVPEQQRGRAITFVFLGWSVASVLGMPIGAYLGGTLGWRSAFWLVAVLSVISAAWVLRSMPSGVKPPAMSRAAWAATLQSPALMTCVLVTTLYAAGQFVLFAYLAPYYKASLDISALQLSALFMWFGAFGLIGNIWMSRHVDRLGAPRMVWMGLSGMILSLLIWPLGTTLLLAAIVMLPWAIGGFATNSAQQARLVGLAPALASGSVSLNTSAMYAGQAIGAALGGLLISAGHMNDLHWYGLAGLLLALVTSHWATYLANKTPPVRADQTY